MNNAALTHQQAELFKPLQEEVLAVLNEPAVTDALGEQGRKIADALASAFSVDVVDGYMEVPDDQVEQNNIGVFILPQGKALYPATSRYFGVPAPRHTPEGWKVPDHPPTHQRSRTLQAAASYFSGGIAHIVPPPQKILLPDMRTRELIVMGSRKASNRVHDRVSTAAVIAHEVDHSLKKQEIFESTGYDFRVSRNFAKNSVPMERRGYKVSGAIAEAFYEPAFPVSAESFANVAVGRPPRRAAAIMNNRAAYIRSKIVQAPKGSPERELLNHRLMSARVGAATLLFGPKDIDAAPTPEEVKAFQAIGAVWSRRVPASYPFILPVADLKEFRQRNSQASWERR